MHAIAMTGLVLLLGCAAGGDGEQPATGWRVEVGDARDSVRVQVPPGAAADEAVVVAVTSPRGIGSARFAPADGDWPDSVRVRLDLLGLEGLTVRGGGLQLDLSVTSAGQVRRSQRRIDEHGVASDVTIAPDDPLWMPLSIDALPVKRAAASTDGATASGEPTDRGMPAPRRFTVALPRAFLAVVAAAPAGSPAATLAIHWIDFYRR
jgi:hypothetical protein